MMIYKGLFTYVVLAEKSDDRYDNDRRYSQDAMQIETKAPELSSEEKILNMLEKTGWKAGRGKSL